MSAFARHPRRRAYEAAAKAMTPLWMRRELRKLSPQNRRVRFAVDTDMAREKLFPNHETRQQRRRIARTGRRIVTHNPGEVAD